jgi:serine/threonine-protein kinase
MLRERLGARYDLAEVIGRGGMAVVYRATDRRHDRAVALKVLQAPVVRSLEHADRFLREVRFAAQLAHPHILPLYDSGELDGPDGPLLYYVMPLVTGGSLRDRLRAEQRLPVDHALRIGRAVATALDFAHRQQVVHRDVKPENILLQDGEPLVADFGVARALCEACAIDGTITAPGIAIGTPAYMSPEQASGDPGVDARSDQYSLACVIYEMLAGSPPFAGSTPRATMARHATEPARSPRTVRPEVPAAVEQALLRALAKVPDSRYPTTAEFAAALVTPLSGLAPDFGAYARQAIAVLPFVNASADPDNEYISDGVTDEVINALAKLSGLQVASRSSVFALKGRHEDARTIGALLGVSILLEGTVRKLGSRLRVTAQLTDASEGRLLWSERWDRDDSDIFAMQDDLARAIVARLRAHLLGPIGEPIPRKSPASLHAYNLYLRGRYAWNRRTPEGVREATRLFEQAIAEDPGYALAYTGLADAYALEVDYRAIPVTEGMRRARTEAERALALDDSLAEAHTSLAWVTFIHDWDWERAGREFRRAIELNPHYATARQWYSWYLAAMGRVPEGVLEAQRATELDPASVSIRRSLGWLYCTARRPDLARAVLERALVMNPEAPETLTTLGLAEEQAGRYEEAARVLRDALLYAPGDSNVMVTQARVAMKAGRPDEALAIASGVRMLERTRYVSPSDLAKLAIGLGETDQAFAALERARQERRGWLVYLRADPLFDPIRDEPRFRQLRAAMRLD